jgi:hypothetical protein
VTRPTAAYVGMGLSHPIRLVMNRGLLGNHAKLLSISEALELTSDLTSAIARAIDQEKTKSPRTESTHASYPTGSARAAPPDLDSAG